MQSPSTGGTMIGGVPSCIANTDSDKLNKFFTTFRSKVKGVLGGLEPYTPEWNGIVEDFLKLTDIMSFPVKFEERNRWLSTRSTWIYAGKKPQQIPHGIHLKDVKKGEEANKKMTKEMVDNPQNLNLHTELFYREVYVDNGGVVTIATMRLSLKTAWDWMSDMAPYNPLTVETISLTKHYSNWWKVMTACYAQGKADDELFWGKFQVKLSSKAMEKGTRGNSPETDMSEIPMLCAGNSMDRSIKNSMPIEILSPIDCIDKVLDAHLSAEAMRKGGSNPAAGTRGFKIKNDILDEGDPIRGAINKLSQILSPEAKDAIFNSSGKLRITETKDLIENVKNGCIHSPHRFEMRTGPAIGLAVTMTSEAWKWFKASKFSKVWNETHRYNCIIATKAKADYAAVMALGCNRLSYAPLKLIKGLIPSVPPRHMMDMSDTVEGVMELHPTMGNLVSTTATRNISGCKGMISGFTGRQRFQTTTQLGARFQPYKLMQRKAFKGSSTIIVDSHSMRQNVNIVCYDHGSDQAKEVPLSEAVDYMDEEKEIPKFWNTTTIAQSKAAYEKTQNKKKVDAVERIKKSPTVEFVGGLFVTDQGSGSSGSSSSNRGQTPRTSRFNDFFSRASAEAMDAEDATAPVDLFEMIGSPKPQGAALLSPTVDELHKAVITDILKQGKGKIPIIRLPATAESYGNMMADRKWGSALMSDLQVAGYWDA